MVFRRSGGRLAYSIDGDENANCRNRLRTVVGVLYYRRNMDCILVAAVWISTEIATL